MLAKGLILYADDNKEDVELMNTVFRDHPEYILVPFESGLPLLDYLHSAPVHQVSLILLDINMPDLGGLATLRIIRSDEKIKHLTVVMFSTATSPSDRKNSNLLGAEVLMKPDTGTELPGIRERILKHCHIRDNSQVATELTFQH